MTPEELKGRFCWEVWHQRDKPCEGCPMLLAKETGQPQEGEIRSPDGRVWFIRGNPIRNENGQLLGFTEFTQDITELRRTEAALRESELRFRTLFETMTQGVIITDVKKDGRYDPATDQPVGLNTKSILCAPIDYCGEVIGTLEAINRNEGNFDQDSLLILSGIANLAGTAIRHAQLYEQLEAAHQSYQDLFEDSIDPILITDWSGKPRFPVSVRGRVGSENAGTSSERGGRNPSAECPRVPGEGSSAQG